MQFFIFGFLFMLLVLVKSVPIRPTEDPYDAAVQNSMKLELMNAQNPVSSGVLRSPPPSQATPPVRLPHPPPSQASPPRVLPPPPSQASSPGEVPPPTPSRVSSPGVPSQSNSGSPSTPNDAAAGQTPVSAPTITQQQPQFSIPIKGNPSVPNKSPIPGIPNKVEGPPPLPNLFPLSAPPIPLPAEECLTKDGEVGECLSAYDCGQSNGLLSGLCHQGMDGSAYPRVCCTYQAHCGFSTSKQVSYFRSPAWPQLISNHSACKLEVDLNPGVCQVRLDFLDFHLDGMTNGVCSPSNQMVINSTIRHAYLPTNTLCGNLSPTNSADPLDNLRTDLPHLYLHLEDLPVDRKVAKLPNAATPSISLSVKVTNHPSKWNIRVTQIQCDGAPLQAPPGCAQYYNSLSGTMASLNFYDNQYMTNMDMAACIRLDQRACAIAYTIDSMNVGSSRGNKLSYGLTCGDYISFNGEKTGMCGAAVSREVVLPVRGGQGVYMHSDSRFSKSDVGFKMQFRYIRDCSGVQYFRYPQPK